MLKKALSKIIIFNFSYTNCPKLCSCSVKFKFLKCWHLWNNQSRHAASSSLKRVLPPASSSENQFLKQPGCLWSAGRSGLPNCCEAGWLLPALMMAWDKAHPEAGWVKPSSGRLEMLVELAGLFSAQVRMIK